MKFCFATTDAALCTDFIDTSFSKVNPCFLQHHAGVGPQIVWMYNSVRLWSFTAGLLQVPEEVRGP